MVNNKVIAIWTGICYSGTESKEFLEELERFHERILKRKQITKQEKVEE